MQIILKPDEEYPLDQMAEGESSQDSRLAGTHLSAEDLACLAENCVTPEERLSFVHHLNRCRLCSDRLADTLGTLPENSQLHSAPSHKWWSYRAAHAVAASVFLIILVSGGLYYRDYMTQPVAVLQSIAMDDELKDLLSEDDILSWEGEKADRLAQILKKRGVPVKKVKRVLLASAYEPPMTKSLFVPREVLKVRIEGDLIYLEVTPE
jgi:hypothetical protein